MRFLVWQEPNLEMTFYKSLCNITKAFYVFSTMPFYFNKYSGLLLIFFVHGLVYAILLYRKGLLNDKSSDKWLSFFLLLAILYICPWMLGFAGWYDGRECLACRNFLFYFPFQQTLFFGPVILFYVHSLLNPLFQFKRKHWLHFIPGILFLLWNVIIAVTDRLVLHKYFLMDGENDPDFAYWYIIAGLISIIVYLISAIQYYYNYQKFIVQELSFADTVTFAWVRNFLIAFFIYVFSTLIIAVLNIAGIDIKYTQAWWYYLLFALLFYYIAIAGYNNSIENKVSFEPDFLKYRMPYQLNYTQQGTEPLVVDAEYEEIVQEGTDAKTEDNNVLTEWKQRVLTAVVDNKEYRNAELTLTQLAKQLQTNASFLSKIINQCFKMNFNDFINYYRVQEVKERLVSADNSHLTIMSIAIFFIINYCG